MLTAKLKDAFSYGVDVFATSYLDTDHVLLNVLFASVPDFTDVCQLL